MLNIWELLAFEDWQFWVLVILPASVAIITGTIAIITAYKEGLHPSVYTTSFEIKNFYFFSYIGFIVIIMFFSLLWTLPLSAFGSRHGKDLMAVVGSSVLMRDGKVVTDVTGKHFYWWQIPAEEELVNYVGAHTSKMHLSPVTDNPKVRDLHYSVRVEVIFSDVAALRLYFDKIYGKESLDNYTKRILYNFNELHSKEMAKFFNPLDPDQQQRFQELVTENLAGEFATAGLQIVSASFTLE